jgi:DNA polymerase III sliding clamp (beta) subunit (PCNA family)
MNHETIAAEAATEARARFTIAARPFADAVKLLSGKVTEKRPTYPILSALLIEAAPCGRVTITATDLDIWATVTLQADPSEAIEPGALCLDAGALSDAMAKAHKGSERVRLVAGDDYRATLKAGRGEFKLRGLPIDDYPMPKAAEVDCAGELSRVSFLRDLKALAPAVCTEESRYCLNGYALQVRELGGADRFAMVATNGGNMAAASRPIPAGLESWADAILSRKTGAVMLAADKVAGDGRTITLSRLGGMVQAEFGAVRIVAKLIDWDFPDWQLAFAGACIPTEATEAALFPDMMPGRPLAAMEALAKASAVPIVWQESLGAFIGESPDDAGLAWCCNALRTDNEPRKGYRYSDGESRDHARAYLKALAEAQGLPGADTFRNKAERLNEQRGRQYYASSFYDLQTSGGRVLGLTIGGKVAHYATYETVKDWETLSNRVIEVPAYDEAIEGSYSILMPADGPVIEHDYSVSVEGDRTYPVAVNANATQIHLSKEQVAALCGDSVFEVIELASAKGKPRYVSAWCYEQGDSRLLCVGKDGRTPKAGALREYVTREQVAAALAGEAITAEPEAVSAPETALVCVAEAAPATHAAETPEIVPLSAPVAAEAATDADACPIAAIRARLAEVEAMLAALPAQSARPKRTPAHERAIRRAWAERKARREAQWQAAEWEDAQHRAWSEGVGHKLKRRRAVLAAFAARMRTRHFIGQMLAEYDRRNLAESEAREALAMRDQMRGMLASLERRAEAAEAENAELWAEIEKLTAPATPVGATANQAAAA